MRTRLASGAMALPVLAIAACAAIPPGGMVRAKPPAAYRADLALAAPRAPWPGDGWWRAYGDAQLDGLIDEALAGSPDVAAAKARLARANAAAGAARGALLPTLEGQGEAAETKQSYNLGIPPAFVPHGYHAYGQVTLNFDWELDFWGRNRAQLAAAVSEAKASRADLAEARLILSTSVASAYADLLRLWDERDVDERAEQSRRETLELVKQRVANGLDTQGELSEAEAGPAAARADIAATDEQIALARDRIAALLGDGPDRGLAIKRPKALQLQPFGLPRNLAADLIGRRPDLTAERWRAEAAAERVGAARAAFYPNVNLAALAGYESLGISSLFAAGSGIGRVGPAATLPIFEGGRLRAQLSGARADYAAAVAGYDGALSQALREVADAAASERALSSRLSDSAEALADDDKAYRIAHLRYQGGLADYQSVLLAEDKVLQSRRAVIDLKARAFTLDVQLVRALGGGYREDRDGS